MTIASGEITYSKLSLVDIGQVFWWKGRLFRGFNTAAVAPIRKMFDCGLVDRLIAEGMLVKSWISEEQFAAYSFVVEHEVVRVPIYPREWSFSMLKDAADLILRINDVARRFGYQTKDCNGYNVLFRNESPVFVDLASFIEVSKDEDTLFAYEEFLLSYYYPLYLWASAGQNLGNRALPRAVGQLVAPETYLRYRWPILRRLSDRHLIAGFKILTSLRTLRHNDMQKLRQRRTPQLVRLLMTFKRSGIFRSAARIERLRERVSRCRNRTGGGSMWAAYHDSYRHGHSLSSTPRFDTIVSRLQHLQVQSVLEFAGNQGVVSRLLKQAVPSLPVICSDVDGVAIDKGYMAARATSAGITWAIYNPFAPEGSPVEIPAEDRFKSDAVVALALTHHLTLTQGFKLRYIFDVIARHSRQYALVEFMPLGLHDGQTGPEIPPWYREEWFAEEFSRRFEVIERIQLESNRVLYVGRLRQQVTDAA